METLAMDLVYRDVDGSFPKRFLILLSLKCQVSVSVLSLNLQVLLPKLCAISTCAALHPYYLLSAASPSLDTCTATVTTSNPICVHCINNDRYLHEEDGPRVVFQFHPSSPPPLLVLVYYRMPSL
ncbi:hypothetical protein GQX74_009207 [Glossina fuscipes]|nr:hypothetical protein GQX74_009207 [Glossina fuscipes]